MALKTAVIDTVRHAWTSLNGLVCVYKPAEFNQQVVKRVLISNICRVLVVNEATRSIRELKLSRSLSAYHIKGRFGLATESQWTDGKIWEKTTYVHLTKQKFIHLLSSVQASHQRKMFEYCGVDPTSQLAYELAKRGLLRPAMGGPTLIYGIKCIDFQLPSFTLELHCINEDEAFLSTLIHDLGVALKSAATCEQIRCIRYGYFTIENALLRKHWNLENVLNNMRYCHTVLTNRGEVAPNLTPIVLNV